MNSSAVGIPERDSALPHASGEQLVALSSGEIWHAATDIIRKDLNEQIFSAWIRPLKVNCDVSENQSGRAVKINVLAPNKFSCEHIKRDHSELIASAVCSVTGAESVTIKYGVDSGVIKNAPSSFTSSESIVKSVLPNAASSRTQPATQKERAAAGKERAQRRAAAQGTGNLNPAYNFSNFVVGSCNQFAHAASLRVAENLGITYNPFFLYGGVGLGKTHLAMAIGNASRRRGKSVLFVSSEVFVNELISAIRSNNMHQFRARFRSLDLLIIDDIQFLIGKERTQEEFFHTFNDLYQRHKQIIVTSDKLPQELVGLDERLRTRFTSGLSADLQVPDFETRSAILQKKAEAEEVSVPKEVISLVAEKIDTNVRELEGALNRLFALSSLQNTPITMELARDALHSFLPETLREITTEYIQQAVAEYYNVSLSDILGKRRTQNIAFARQVAMFLCRNLTGRSYPEIGALFGGRDHSTVIHAYKVVEERMGKDKVINDTITSLQKKIGG